MISSIIITIIIIIIIITVIRLHSHGHHLKGKVLEEKWIGELLSDLVGMSLFL